MKRKLLVLMVLLPWMSATHSADKIESIAIAKGVSHYQSSKHYSEKIPVHFAGSEYAFNVQETLEEKSFKLRTSARAKKDKDDSELEFKLKIRGVCNYVFSSVVAKMQEYAEEIGADTIINIRSDYGGNPAKDPDSYDCIRGSMLSAVELKAEFVKLNP